MAGVGQRTEASKPSGFATIGVASSQVVAENRARVELVICNDHATNVVYLSLGTTPAAVGSGIRLAPGGGSYTTETYTGAVQAIATGAGTNVCYAAV